MSKWTYYPTLPWFNLSNNMQRAVLDLDPRNIPAPDLDLDLDLDVPTNRAVLDERNAQLWAACMILAAQLTKVQIPALEQNIQRHQGTPRGAVYATALALARHVVDVWRADFGQALSSGKKYVEVLEDSGKTDAEALEDSGKTDAEALEAYRRLSVIYAMLQTAMTSQAVTDALAGAAAAKDGGVKGGAAGLDNRKRQARRAMAVELYRDIAAMNPALTRAGVIARVSERMKQEARRNPGAPFVHSPDDPERGLSATRIRLLLKDIPR